MTEEYHWTFHAVMQFFIIKIAFLNKLDNGASSNCCDTLADRSIFKLLDENYLDFNDIFLDSGILNITQVFKESLSKIINTAAKKTRPKKKLRGVSCLELYNN